MASSVLSAAPADLARQTLTSDAIKCRGITAAELDATKIETQNIFIGQPASFTPSVENTQILWSQLTSPSGSTEFVNARGTGSSGGFRFLNGDDGATALQLKSLAELTQSYPPIGGVTTSFFRTGNVQCDGITITPVDFVGQPSAGTLTLNGATPVAVATNACDPASLIFLSRNVTAGTAGFFGITAQSATGFSVTGTAGDTSTVNWWIVNPNYGT